MNRRQMLIGTGVATASLGFSSFPLGWTAEAKKNTKKILMYTKSEGFEHPVVRRNGDKLSFAEIIAIDLGKKHGFEVVCEKDGRIFASDDLKQFDGFLFQSQCDVTKEKSVDKQPPMPADGKKGLLKAVEDGKGFVGCHCASDTFHSAGHHVNRWKTQAREEVDPYIAMVGGEFAGHGRQQRGWMKVIDSHFPGIKGTSDFGVQEEWYSLKNFAPDLHVILLMETKGMVDQDYQRPDFPATWARMHGKGRVFYTSFGHREDVWTNPLFQQILLGGLAWSVGNVDANVTPNIEKVAAKANELPKS
jgi:type 1 glutamine amidotransferase